MQQASPGLCCRCSGELMCIREPRQNHGSPQQPEQVDNIYKSKRQLLPRATCKCTEGKNYNGQESDDTYGHKNVIEG